MTKTKTNQIKEILPHEHEFIWKSDFWAFHCI